MFVNIFYVVVGGSRVFIREIWYYGKVTDIYRCNYFSVVRGFIRYIV